MKEDRRIRKTKSAIKRAFTDLLKRKTSTKSLFKIFQIKQILIVVHLFTL